jgi:hypothetical protein
MKRAAMMAAVLFWASQSMAESKFGVEVYPGAKADAGVTKSLEQKLKLKNASAYRTSDSVAKVCEFYRKQGLKEQPGTRAEGAMFTGQGVNVTIQNPWMDMESGKMMNDTLVSIVKS